MSTKINRLAEIRQLNEKVSEERRVLFKKLEVGRKSSLVKNEKGEYLS